MWLIVSSYNCLFVVCKFCLKIFLFNFIVVCVKILCINKKVVYG